MSLEPIILAELQRGGPPLWVSGRTYPKGWEVRSPTNLQRYVRKVAGEGATDPSADPDNWEPWSKTVDTTLAALGTSVANVKAVADALEATLASVKTSVDAINAAKGIKSIQRGVITIPTFSVTSVSVAISAVNPAKTELRWLGGAGYEYGSGSPVGSRVVLTSATTVTAYVTSVTSGEMPISWELTEFN